MNKKIAILRGINVGGKRRILMADLKLMFEEMNFSNVFTYIQSGNVFFEIQKEYDHSTLSREIEEQIQQQFGFEVPVIVRTPKEIATAIKQNPFCKQGAEIEHLHLTFLSDKPILENQKALELTEFAPDKFELNATDVFIYCHGKYHESKLTNNFFEKKLKVNATTRNWKTVLKLAELSQAN